jgi:GH15 family glucan-1,4-alpha-glucosidase
MVEDLARIGQKEEARELMDTLLEKQNNVGLWPEELDPATDEYLGNYPQAFTHTALIGAALTLEEKFS